MNKDMPHDLRTQTLALVNENKPANAPELLAQKDIDGGLIGGASLEARSFVDLVNAAVAAK